MACLHFHIDIVVSTEMVSANTLEKNPAIIKTEH